MEVSTFIWMFVVLKVPVIAALWLVWYAVREPEPLPDEGTGGGGSDREPDPRPHRPRPPRRGPHAGPPPAPPRRVRTATGRKLVREP